VARAKLVYPDSYVGIINMYLNEKKQKCFTYRGIRSWLFKHEWYRDIEWHTFERMIRKLSEDGYLDRVFLSGKKVIFCRNDKFEDLISIMKRRKY